MRAVQAVQVRPGLLSCCFSVVLMVATSSCDFAPGDDFPDFVIENRCGVTVDWVEVSDSNSHFEGTLQPDEVDVVHPAAENSVLTVSFSLPNGRVVEKTGVTPMALTPAECA